jgi:4'-phosphopantetheinyl transferase
METCASVSDLAATSKRIPLADAAIEVRLARLDLDADQVGYCASLLSHDEQLRAKRFHFERDRGRFIVARGILRILLGSHLGITPAKVAFGYTKNGKPFVADHAGQIHFNISHSSERALYAISNRCALGVDIEHMNRDIDYANLAERFFSRREHAELQLIPESDRKRAFFACWTRKEAVIKATGEGLSLPLDQFEVTVAPDAAPRVIDFAGAAQRATHWILYDVNVGDGYIATVAACHRIP